MPHMEISIQHRQRAVSADRVWACVGVSYTVLFNCLQIFFRLCLHEKRFLFWKNVNSTEKPRERWIAVVVAVGAAAACDVMEKECSTSSSNMEYENARPWIDSSRSVYSQMTRLTLTHTRFSPHEKRWSSSRLQVAIARKIRLIN